MFVTAHGKLSFTWFEWSVWKTRILIASFADCATRLGIDLTLLCTEYGSAHFLTQKNKFKSCSFQSLRH